jgi:hypothetical protein
MSELVRPYWSWMSCVRCGSKFNYNYVFVKNRKPAVSWMCRSCMDDMPVRYEWCSAGHEIPIVEEEDEV